MKKIVEEKTFEYSVIQDAEGNIVHNSFQQDDPAIRRKYDDGVITVTSSRDGRNIVPPFRVDDHGEATVLSDWTPD